MKRFSFILFSFAIALAIMSFFYPWKDLLFEKHTYEKNGDKLPYRFLKPQNIEQGKKFPLVIFLHGAGERGNDNESQLSNGVNMFSRPAVMRSFPCYMIIPQCPEGMKWVNTDWTLDKHTMPEKISTPLNSIIGIMNEIIKTYPIDTCRIYLTGVSMGGFGVWDLLQRFPDKFAAAAPVCGGADENFALKIKNIPVWVFHGGNDKVVKTIRSRNIINALKNAGGNPTYTEYAGLGHNAWDSAYKDDKIPAWLFKHSLINCK